MWIAYFLALGIMLVLGVATWLLSIYLKDVSIVDSLWSIMFLAAGIMVIAVAPEISSKAWLLLGLLMLWSLRLSIFLTIRNWGEEEDRRYQDIRKNNSPNFTFKSLYIIFGLQALIAWVVFLGLLPGLYLAPEFTVLDWVAIALWCTGMFFEVEADIQLYRFKQNPANKGRVLDSGLWRYSRHPNYFGEFLIWWAFFLISATTGAWWAIIAPVIMTILLLKVSGVGLMEKGISNRRPEYQAYIDRTNAFIPWLQKKPGTSDMEAMKS
jgi:steroid 5-alpha reductase family enzyme